ncbi:hypothetical protein [Streptacidiphilus fuscans]|uniref:Dirigent protein n=1 Tax=Streptacidiphilus fuscans TaxID=2789292 RepID=A0A931B296_9ACTN|nr:hypothetical protein [Streptacidiphilus fuscans]MBF9069054.1 hypothetical protein [Streptacidiphilus fuscans]
MSSHARFLVASAALAAGLLAATTATAGAASGSPGPSGPPPMTMPSASSTPGGSSSASGAMATTTWKFYSVSTESNLYTAGGQLITNPSTAPAVGDSLVGTDNFYTGDHTNHSSDISATDHLFCLVTKAPATATCSAEIATSQGMLVADNAQLNFASQAPTQTVKITGGTGAYQGAKGTVMVTSIGNTNNSDVVVTWSK